MPQISQKKSKNDHEKNQFLTSYFFKFEIVLQFDPMASPTKTSRSFHDRQLFKRFLRNLANVLHL